MSFLVDLHVHTSTTSPCGQITPEDAVLLYKEAGVHGIAITDHFYRDYFDGLGKISWKEKIDCFLEGYRRAKKAGEQENLAVYLGIEFRNYETDDDFLVLGLTEQFLYDHENPYELPLDRAIALFQEAGAIVIQAHPVRMRLAVLEDGKIRKNYKAEEMTLFLKEHPDTKRMDFIEGIRKIKAGELEAFREPVFLRVCELRCPKLLDGFEYYNGNYNWMQDEQETEKIATTYPNLIQVASSDFHEPGHCARGLLALEKEAETVQTLISQMQKQQFHKIIQQKSCVQ